MEFDFIFWKASEYTNVLDFDGLTVLMRKNSERLYLKEKKTIWFIVLMKKKLAKIVFLRGRFVCFFF